MSDCGEIYKGMREESQKRKAKNLLTSTNILKEQEIKFKSMNNGVHLFIFNGEFDFYPSTGLFRSRETGKRGRGIYNLLKRLDNLKTKKKYYNPNDN